MVVFAGLNDVVIAFLRDPRGHKVVLQPGNPAALYGFFQLSLVDIFHRHFFVRLCTCPQGSAQVSRSTGGGAGRRIGAGITLQLREQVAVPRLAALVINQIADLYIVQTTLEREALDVVDAVFAEFQVNNQLILAWGQFVGLFLSAENRTT